jgi:hypothetical protein
LPKPDAQSLKSGSAFVIKRVYAPGKNDGSGRSRIV